MRLIASCQLHGDYGTVATGQEFLVSDEDGLKLIAQGAARRAPPRYETKPAVYETQVLHPQAPQVSPRLPFRDVSNIDPEPPALAAVRTATSAVPDVQESGNPSDRGRGRRKAPNSK